MQVVTVVGARPQFIKAAPVSQVLRQRGHEEMLVHTGQHYDHGMSTAFFEELALPEPAVDLGVGSGPHGWQTGLMLAAIEELLMERMPDNVLVYGDTNSTLAGALAASKLRLTLCHVEAGLRSFNWEMPEECNRVLTDHCSDVLFCPTGTAVDNLRAEGIEKGVFQVGDTMYDAVVQFRERAEEEAELIDELGVRPGEFLLATVHRPYNTDDPDVLRSILAALGDAGETVVFPIHPRTRKMVDRLDEFEAPGGLMLIDPVSYLEMLTLESHARLVLTDSGGVQKEAYFLGTPCLTLRPETEWVETVESGWNRLVGSDYDMILEGIDTMEPPDSERGLFGGGDASEKIVRVLEENA